MVFGRRGSRVESANGRRDWVNDMWNVGRASGFTDMLPQNIAARWIRPTHHMVEAGYTYFRTDQVAWGEDGYNAIRGREQHAMEWKFGAHGFGPTDAVRNGKEEASRLWPVYESSSSSGFPA